MANHSDTKRVKTAESGHNVPIAETSVEETESQSGIKKIKRFIRKHIFAIFLGMSALGHGLPIVKEMTYINPEKALAQEREQEQTKKYQKKIDDVEEMIKKSGLPEAEKQLLKVEHQAITARNTPRLDQKKQLIPEAEKLKESYLQNAHFTPEFALEYERLVEGVSPKIIEKAERNFETVISALKLQVTEKKPTIQDLQKIVWIFVPPDSPQEDTIAHAADALALRAPGIIANCDAKNVLFAMAMTSLYPDIQEDLYVQEFGNHVRLLYKDPQSQQIHIMEGTVTAFPDAQTNELVTRVLPLEEYWKSMFGIPEKDLKKVTYYGPSDKKESQEPNITDRLGLEKSTPTKNLGMYRTVQQENVDPTERKQGLAELNDQLEFLAKHDDTTIETELIPELLDEKTAKKMIKERAYGMLRFYPKISPEAVKLILKEPEFRRPFTYGFIGFGVKRLTKEFIEALTENSNQETNIHLVELESLSVEEATLLKNLQTNWLSFPKLKSINAKTARELAQVKTLGLAFDGLTTLSHDVVRELAQAGNTYLGFNGLTTLSHDVVRELAQAGNTYLALDGLTTLSPETVRELAQGDIKHLMLNGLITLSPETARELAQMKTWGFSLNGLTTLSPETARELAQGDIKYLMLNGLTTLSPETAHELAQLKTKELELGGLTTLSPPVARELGQADIEYLTLNGLTTLSPETARELAQMKTWGFNLNGLTTLSPETARELAQMKTWGFSLNGLTTLSPETARELAQGDIKYLMLNGLTTLSPETAHELAQLKTKELELGGLTTLSPAVARELAQLNAEELLLSLGLTTLSPEAAHELTQLKIQELGLGLETMSLDVARELVQSDIKINLRYLHATPEIEFILASNPKISFQRNSR